MLSTETLSYLIERFELDQLSTFSDGSLLYFFSEPFSFMVNEVDGVTLTFIAPLDFGPSIDRELVMRRLLESNLQGCETGAGAIGLFEGYGICYRETIDLKDMEIDAFQSRFVDFSLYVYYWMTEGIKTVQDETSPPIMGEGMIRL